MINMGKQTQTRVLY